MITFQLDKILEEKQVTRYYLAKAADIPYPTVDRYFKHEVTRFDSYILDKMCKVLGCTPGDLIVYIPDKD